MWGEKIKFSYTPYRLKFKEPGGTSRGILYEKLTYIIKLQDQENADLKVYGEVPYFQGLSKEPLEIVESKLKDLCKITNYKEITEESGLSSLDFGIQQIRNAIKNYETGFCFPSPFTQNSTTITINGLIWMGAFSEMYKRVLKKIEDGFTCIKLKIGAINWDDEILLIKKLRDIGGENLTIRVDANGAFSVEECMYRLDTLSRYNIHSIEQPIQAGNYKEMKKICESSPIPVALDEDLVGLPVNEQREELLNYIKPAYLILKPALCFGFNGASDWIKRAERNNIGWWITSALESTIGLTAIAEYTGALNPNVPQGLGTGNLYYNNFLSPLRLLNDKLEFVGPSHIYYDEMEKLEWREQ